VEGESQTLEESIESSDFTKASNWFPGARNRGEFEVSKVTFYTISIPSLKIENATVAIGGEDLSKNLIQYPGTALPGRTGNTVIFGHSILPQFYNPKDYLAIFSTLPSLRKGDEIGINYDGITYKFRVESLFEVNPSDLEVLEQGFSEPYVSLVTCVPPGHPLKPRRLIVRAKIVPF
jgi:sortase A